jgi:hypothetical protein
MAVDLQSLYSVELETDRLRIGLGCNDEVLLQLLLAVVDQIYAWVDTAVADFGVSGHIPVPFRRIVTEEVVGHSGQLV